MAEYKIALRKNENGTPSLKVTYEKGSFPHYFGRTVTFSRSDPFFQHFHPLALSMRQTLSESDGIKSIEATVSGDEPHN